MTTIDTISPSTTVPKAAPRSAIGSDFETFLRMLTTQLKNQDPLNPMESSDFAVQLATFSSVEQQVLTNDLLTALSGQMGQMGMAQLANWVGMQARAPVDARFDGFPISLHVSPVATADSARLLVRDETGAIVQTLPIPVSGDTYTWTGRDATGQSLPVGIYSFALESWSQGDLVDSKTPETFARIEEARLESGKTMLVLEGGGTIDADQITALRQ